MRGAKKTKMMTNLVKRMAKKMMIMKKTMKKMKR